MRDKNKDFIIKRLKYNNGQLLDEYDFQDEQDYHREMRMRHNRYIHGWGIAEGLDVDVSTDGTEITVSAGMAIDKDGQELVLLRGEKPVLPTGLQSAARYLTAKFKPEDDDTVIQRDADRKKDYSCRTVERPKIKVTDTDKEEPANDGSVIVLAKLNWDEAGKVTVGSSVRSRSVSLNPKTDLTVRSLLVEGKVGIGTTDPKSALSVKGGLAVGTNYAGTNTAPDNGLLVEGTVGIGTTSPRAKLEVAVDANDADTKPLVVGKDTNYLTMLNNGNVGIGTTAPVSKLHIDKGRVDITTSDVTGGGQNRFDGLRGWNAEATHRRGQLVLSSSYSDLVIASSHANDNHGSTLTLATYNPTDATDYRKWVINQGNWGARKQFLDFGYSDAKARENPHDNINNTDTVLTLNGVKKRVGIGTTTPEQKLHVVGDEILSTGRLSGFKFRNRESISNTDDWVWYSADNIARFWRAKSGDLMGISTTGNVGIGTTGPKSALSVKGGLAVGTNYAEKSTAPDNDLLVEGNVGIGTPTPGARLEVMGVVRAETFEPTNPLRHRMYPADPQVYQDMRKAEQEHVLMNKKLSPPAYEYERDRVFYPDGAEVTIPEGYDTVWVRVSGVRWTGMKVQFSDGDKEDLGYWAGGFHGSNCYCPDGSLSDGSIITTEDGYGKKHSPSNLTDHQWVPIPAGRAGKLTLISHEKPTITFWLSGLAFSKNPWGHVAVHPFVYWEGLRACSPRLFQDGDGWRNWEGDLLFALEAGKTYELKIPVIPTNRDKLLYLIEHNSNWNGCVHGGIWVEGKSVERFLATYDNPFARHWNSKTYERYIAARIPTDIVSTKKVLTVKIKANCWIHVREIGTHDLDVPWEQ